MLRKHSERYRAGKRKATNSLLKWNRGYTVIVVVIGAVNENHQLEEKHHDMTTYREDGVVQYPGKPQSTGLFPVLFGAHTSSATCFDCSGLSGEYYSSKFRSALFTLHYSLGIPLYLKFNLALFTLHCSLHNLSMLLGSQ